MSYKTKLAQITTFIFDVDGVLTDGKVLVTTDGALLRSMNIKDGFALKYAVDMGFNVAIISGGTNEGVRTRLEGLGIKQVYLGAHQKTQFLEAYCQEHDVSPDEIAYMGDDIPDIPVLRAVGLATCPQDAVPEVKASSAYISHKRGGEGCARDLIEQVLKVHAKWV
ncbi:KdsC family phosphatase [Gilvibacter sediminis]|uniref:KdsC family phosphatase n=1 Tax=Gilvibacter sediminis TaxID=379071 RepID=UPI00235085F3|nr:HAD-IIIA family hydrolase [Gilvibacter sediminis]MDC7998191.1 HAD-IIIA family hydrolase [Gilvibacter sediminis]